MGRLQIGMWGELDLEKWDRWSAECITGVETCSASNREALQELAFFCEEKGLRFGIHAPVLSTNGYRLPRLSDPDPRERDKAWKQLEEEVRLAASVRADYVLFHYPLPSIFPVELKRNYPKITSPEYACRQNDLSREEFHAISERLFETISELQSKYNQRIVLEHDFFGDYGDVLADMLDRYPDVQLVVDMARLDVWHRSAFQFDPLEWLTRVARHVYLIHYSNVRYIGDDDFKHHLPSCAEYDQDENYGDSYDYLKHLLALNPGAHITFEHHADLISREQLEAIYERVAALKKGEIVC